MTVVGLTGASGRLGRLVGESLGPLLDPADIVLLTRSPGALAPAAEAGIDVRRVDFDEPETLPAAFSGIDRLLVISTDRVGVRVRQHRAAFAAAADAGVKHVIYTSMLKPTTAHPSRPLAADHRVTEETLRSAGPIWTVLRFGFFAESLIGSTERAIASGHWVSNAGGGHASWVSVGDCAAVAARVLAGGGYEYRVVDVVGPEATSYADIVGLVIELTGRPLELVAVDDETYREGLIGRGVSVADADEYTSFGPAIRQGFATAESDAVEEITGRLPRTLREVLLAYGLPSLPEPSDRGTGGAST